MRESSITDTRQLCDILLSLFTLRVSVCFLPSFFEAASFIQTKKLGFDILIEETQ
jgi:hypothetical protein